MVNPTIYQRILLAVSSIWADYHAEHAPFGRFPPNRTAKLTAEPFDIPGGFPRVNQLRGIPRLGTVTTQWALQALKYVPRKDQTIAYERVELSDFSELCPSSETFEIRCEHTEFAIASLTACLVVPLGIDDENMPL
jgi:hypothetical protein